MAAEHDETKEPAVATGRDAWEALLRTPLLREWDERGRYDGWHARAVFERTHVDEWFAPFVPKETLDSITKKYDNMRGSVSTLDNACVCCDIMAAVFATLVPKDEQTPSESRTIATMLRRWHNPSYWELVDRLCARAATVVKGGARRVAAVRGEDAQANSDVRVYPMA